MKRPSFQFYPGDWLRDTALLSCSVGARGLWIHMICLMHEGTPYGYLKVGDKVILPDNLARMVGATFSEVEGWLSELKAAQVYATDDDGCIFSRRMVRDEKVRAARAAGGFKGGNPALTGDRKVNLDANLEPTPSSSSSTSNQLDNPSDYPARTVSKRSAPKSKAVLDYETGVITGISQSLLTSWEEAYPAIDVRDEIRKAKAWLLANPKNRKANLERFLNTWLTKSQDNARRIPDAAGRKTQFEHRLEVIAATNDYERAIDF